MMVQEQEKKGNFRLKHLHWPGLLQFFSMEVTNMAFTDGKSLLRPLSGECVRHSKHTFLLIIILFYHVSVVEHCDWIRS